MRFNIFSELCSVFFLWCTWAKLFSFIPHGNPYAAIFLLMAIALALAISIRAKKKKAKCALHLAINMSVLNYIAAYKTSNKQRLSNQYVRLRL